MKQVSMSGSLRENVGKKDAKKNRREGKVPCVLYGGKEQIHFAMPEKDFSMIIFTHEVFLINLNIDGKETLAILQDIQYHPVTDVILHADFLEVSDNKPVIIGIPVNFIGNPPGVLKGGKLRKKLMKLLGKGLAKDLPEYITIDVSDLDLNDSIKVNDISIENIELLETPTAEIVGVKTARGAGMGEDEEEAEEEGGEEGATEGDVPAEGGSDENKS